MFPLTTGGTAVIVRTITVVTLLLGWFDDKVAAILEILPLAESGTIIAIDPIAIITLFMGIEESIAATDGYGSAGTIEAKMGGTLAVLRA